MQVTSNKVKDLLAYSHKVLDNTLGRQETTACMMQLFESLLGITPVHLTAEPNNTISESELLQILDGIKKLSQHIPIQHILGKTTFCDLTFQVSDKVLIPRVETEELVYRILRCHPTPDLRVIDIGTGSGCIAISLKKHLPPPSHIRAVDISPHALAIARHNAEQHHADIHFQEMNILQNPIISEANFDLIVSNPPYVCLSERKVMLPRVKDHEPAEALFVPDEAPLLHYHSIARFSLRHLSPKGRVYVEINERFGRETIQCFSQMGFHTRMHRDLFDKDRFVEAWLQVENRT